MRFSLQFHSCLATISISEARRADNFAAVSCELNKKDLLICDNIVSNSGTPVIQPVLPSDPTLEIPNFDGPSFVWSRVSQSLIRPCLIFNLLTYGTTQHFGINVHCALCCMSFQFCTICIWKISQAIWEISNQQDLVWLGLDLGTWTWLHNLRQRIEEAGMNKAKKLSCNKYEHPSIRNNQTNNRWKNVSKFVWMQDKFIKELPAQPHEISPPSWSQSYPRWSVTFPGSLNHMISDVPWIKQSAMFSGTLNQVISHVP